MPGRHGSSYVYSTTRAKKIRNNKKRSVTLLRAHNNMLAHVARARCSDACSSYVSTLVCLTALLTSLQLARPNPPSTFPTHVDWCMYASMSGSLVPTHTNDAPRHPTARMQHQTSPPALLDGTGLLQMPLQRAESPEAKQDNCTNWKHMRTTRSQQRQHEPNETPRLNATHTHQRGNDSAALIAQHLPASPLQAPTTSEHHRPAFGKKKRIPKSRSQAFGQAFDRPAKRKGSKLTEGLAEAKFKPSCYNDRRLGRRLNLNLLLGTEGWPRLRKFQQTTHPALRRQQWTK